MLHHRLSPINGVSPLSCSSFRYIPDDQRHYPGFVTVHGRWCRNLREVRTALALGPTSGAAPGLVSNSILARDDNGRPLGDIESLARKAASIRIGRRDVIVSRPLLQSKAKRVGGSTRGEIKELSEKSRNRMRLAFRNMAMEPKIMLTLTYPAEYPVDGDEVKRHLKAFREWLRRRHIAFAWFLEFQARGAPHFHAFLSAPVARDRVAAAWYKIVASGDERHLRAGTRVEWLRNPEAAGAYADKYASKADQKLVPEGYRNVGRFWGISRAIRPVYRHCWGSLAEMAPAIRCCRGIHAGVVRRRGSGRAWRDSGVVGRTLWGLRDSFLRSPQPSEPAGLLGLDPARITYHGRRAAEISARAVKLREIIRSCPF